MVLAAGARATSWVLARVVMVLREFLVVAWITPLSYPALGFSIAPLVLFVTLGVIGLQVRRGALREPDTTAIALKSGQG